MRNLGDEATAGPRWPWTLVGALALIAAGAGVGWALTTVLTPAEDVLESTPYTYVSADPGEVRSSIQLNVVAEWASVPVGTNRAAGVVTSVMVAAGSEVTAGSTLYTLGLRPVVVAEGEIPAFREIGLKTEGPDVAQLQNMLIERGFYAGLADGIAGNKTVTAVKVWQKSLGLPQTGTVEAGDVIFLPKLPTRIELDSEVIFRGATLAGGEDTVQSLSAAPEFEVPVTVAQAAMMPVGTRVQIASPDGGTWVAFVVEQRPDPETGNILVALEGEDGAIICGEECEQVPVSGATTLQSEIVTVAPVSGLVVPSAALITDADGQIAVILEDGDRAPVTVIAAARGMSVVEGIDEGTRVRVPAEGS